MSASVQKETLHLEQKQRAGEMLTPCGLLVTICTSFGSLLHLRISYIIVMQQNVAKMRTIAVIAFVAAFEPVELKKTWMKA